MRLFRLQAAALGAYASLSFTACSAPELRVAQVDAQAILPAANLKKTDFVRHYRLMTVRNGDELPFTTIGEPPKLDDGAPGDRLTPIPHFSAENSPFG